MAPTIRELRTLTLQQVVTAALLEGVDPLVFDRAREVLQATLRTRGGRRWGRTASAKTIIIDGIRVKRRPS